MATTAEAYGFGARAPYAQPRAIEYDMKQRVRLSGLFPRVRNEPMSTQLQVLLKEFEQNAALTGILERRRRLEERTQYELRSRESVAAMNTNLAPPFRTGNVSFATSAAIASAIAGVPQPAAPVDPLAAARARAEARFAACGRDYGRRRPWPLRHRRQQRKRRCARRRCARRRCAKPRCAKREHAPAATTKPDARQQKLQDVRVLGTRADRQHCKRNARSGGPHRRPW